ncbi:pre-mRNA-splicing factor CWC25 [Neurospora tetraspora]|uniref:Pre-mRNA-splicing factor CWC25 n=1 Tax=Neurospora tetraspora TaxID=94610 RepID=A0AAE0MWX1_9PEZI|nr:pre-mRNA-splicing factor CWC25 [Neurospora tetraspora]
MGSGDLNMKKSWHPQRSGNVAATQKAEAEAIAERKKLQLRLQEIEEERRKEEIQKALEAAGGKRKIDRVEWMYSGPTDGQAGDSAETEAYLLGKRRIDKLLQDNDTKKALSKQPQQDHLSAAGPASVVSNARDVATKIREDPLLAIKRQEQQAYEAMMNDPIKRRQLLASMGIDDSQIAKKDGKDERRHKHRSHHHRSDRHRDRDDDRDRDRDRHSRRRRSDSRDRSRSRSPRRRSDSEEDRSKRRRRDSPDRTRRREPDESRSRRDRDRDDSRSRRHRSPDRSRSRSPGGRSSRRREYSRERGESGPSSRRPDDRSRDQHRPPRRDFTNKEDDRPRYNGGLNKGGRQQQPDGDDKKAEEERAKKLAAMQAAATDLDKAREERLKALAEAERAEREADEKARQQNKKYRGGDAGFMSGLHSRAADMKIADRMNGRV